LNGFHFSPEVTSFVLQRLRQEIVIVAGLFVLERSIGWWPRPTNICRHSELLLATKFRTLLGEATLKRMPQIPNLIHLAMPGFIALLVLEAVLDAFMRRDLYRFKDTAASLTMGTGSVLLGLPIGAETALHLRPARFSTRGSQRASRRLNCLMLFSSWASSPATALQ
jgi:hypothetical protein